MIPPEVIAIRLEICPACAGSAHDPCARCLHGKWGPYEYCPPDLPSLPTQAKNLVQSLTREIIATVSGTLHTTAEESHLRLTICQACLPPAGFFRESDQRCSKCGCFLSAKTRFRSSMCPDGKW